MMQVTVGSEWQTSGGGRRTYALTLDADDLREIKGEAFVKNLDTKSVLAELNRTAEILVVAYVQEQGGMSPEFAARRIAELKNGVS